jgi:diguanylate cyclase (GGDEF)-like protein
LNELNLNELVNCIFIPITGEKRNAGFLILDSSNIELSSELKEKLNDLLNQISISIRKGHFFHNIREFSIRDSLTGIYSRRYFNERYLEDFSKAKRYKQNLSLAMIDIDNFKKVNDTYGHQFGDTVLIQIIKIISSNLRKFNILFRYGGEEFIILFPGLTSKDVFLLCDKIRKQITEFSFYFKREVAKTSITIGIAYFPKDADSPIELIKCADTALYSAKNSGKNKVFIFQK